MKTLAVSKTILAISLLFSASLEAAAGKIQVFKTATCGCCSKWVDHLKAAGFDVDVRDVESTAPYRKKFGVPENLQSCHTAVAGGYGIEGHVPAADIQRLLKTRPTAKGLAVPGMPMGSPGMEGPRADAYSVLLFDPAGKVTVYKSYPAK